MSRSTLTLVAFVSVFLVFAVLGSPAEAVTPTPIKISQMQVPITGETFYNPATATSCAQPVNVTGTLNIVTVVEAVKPPNPNMVTVLANLAGLTGTSSTLGFEGYGRVQLPAVQFSTSLDFMADFSLVAIGVLSPGSPDYPPSPCIGMASDLQVRIRLTFDEDGNLIGATATPLAP